MSIQSCFPPEVCLPSTRAEAKAFGAKHYFTGEMCKRGHVAKRQTSTGTCQRCSADDSAKRRLAAPDKYREINRASRLKNADLVNARRRTAYRENAESVLAAKKSARESDHERFRARERTWYAANADRVKIRKGNWRKNNLEKARELGRKRYADNAEEMRARQRKYKAENKEILRKRRISEYAAKRSEILEAAKKYREDNRERLNAQQRARRESNPEKCRESAMRRRARKHGGTEHYTASQLRSLWESVQHKCACCSAPITTKTRHIDHITPLARGGSNAIRNIQFLCRHCNVSKNARDPIEFMRSRGRLL